ncbi:MAG: tRNA uridine(34) 5-carboxymethylaminomethyl modification radical SAM/GNAT enzyme Elp3 [Candidatus Bathyarchaeota archaeon]|nr:tRNA uridine(34) 5-carboxymethylaminomethyl modification radical SAM/GNAT enzyme Elp3 [Candidatus Bathyarchaeota archaeon]
MLPQLREIIDLLLQIQEPTRKDLEQAKFQVSRKYNLGRIPSNAELIKLLAPEERPILIPILRRKATRAISGVNVVAVMTKPMECPHGRCAYCPGGPENESPQSYTGHEPAAMRGIQNDFDPYGQVRSRVEQLEAIGHTVDKIDLIIMGGTFPASPREYQKSFVKGCLDAMTGIPSASLAEAKKHAETSPIRNVGITLETRPDCLEPSNIDEMLELGTTRVEVGVQNVYEDIYELVGRGHTLQQVIDGTRNMKDSALKICYHMMPGLPGSTKERDLEGFRQIFENPDFKPDMLKIYPTLVIEGTKLYEWWQAGEYTPFTNEDGIELISKVKEMVPPWVRIMRIQRDIPVHQISAGITKSHIRDLVKERLKEHGKRCQCIRCREVGHRARDGVPIDSDSLDIYRRNYDASSGIEEFISAEDDNGTLVGFLRLRLPGYESHRPEITSKTALIRELHVYGEMTPVGTDSSDWQHRGWGERLMEEAEKAAVENYDMNKMIVMSALGTKEYYRRLGYVYDGVYVSKGL